jgi:hypothetical protein
LFKTSELFALTLAGRVFLDERLEIFETAGKFLEAQPANWLTVGPLLALFGPDRLG